MSEVTSNWLSLCDTFYDKVRVMKKEQTIGGTLKIIIMIMMGMIYDSKLQNSITRHFLKSWRVLDHCVNVA